ncbi:MAG: hypothetical protein GC171_11380 [Terrimonas sp.]|nr:hypothetical protein [Terrimonas sp.]
MKYALFLYCWINALPVFSQGVGMDNSFTSPTGNTYALVIGISAYASRGIPQLQYANRDATAFAGFLASKAGGSVPAEHIRLLTDKEATLAAIDDALSWLLQTCEEGDRVFFYFAGHGDMENNTIYKLGFLLAYNTPRTNYINHAVRIEDLNNFANTLSIVNKARVVLITDACHSGNLAGSGFRGNQLVGEQLRTVKANEVRITSCAEDQLSMEDKAWGGGRGVFSYYLVNGLTGLAEKDRNGIVSLQEIKSFLDSSFATDPVLKQAHHQQQPVIRGVGNFSMARVDTMALLQLRSEMTIAADAIPEEANDDPQEMNADQLADDFFQNLSIQKLDQLLKTDSAFRSLVTGITDPAPFEKMRLAGTDDIRPLKKLIPRLEAVFKDDLEQEKKFKKRLVIFIHDSGQDVINAYLSGDAAELERRKYYNYTNSGYDVYPRMYQLALELTSPKNYLYRALEVDQHYFAGVAARLRLPVSENPGPLIEEAFQELQKALALEENAAYIYNELGLLYRLKGNNKQAENFYIKASVISPQWAIPVSNLIGLYATTGEFDKAEAAYQLAKELQPELQGIYINEGVLAEKKKNLLLAEELFRKSIRINSRHYLPFERLGSVYLNTTQYAWSDSFYHEADIRKKGYHFPLPDSDNDGVVDQFDQEPTTMTTVDSTNLDQFGATGFLVWGLRLYFAGEQNRAAVKFRKAIAQDSRNPLAFHYLGKILYESNRNPEADIVFQFALKNYLDTNALEVYIDSILKVYPAMQQYPSIMNTVRQNHYDQIEDHYFLATLYERWHHYTEAEQQYRKIIALQPGSVIGYYQLWNMQEDIGHYKDAEDLIRAFRVKNKKRGEEELYAFYKRMQYRHPEAASSYYDAGVLLYSLAAENPDQYPNDKKYIAPDTQVEKYVIGDKMADIFMDNQLPASPDKSYQAGIDIIKSVQENIKLAPAIQYPMTEGIENLVKADSLGDFDQNAIAAINDMIGDLYVWQGLSPKALTYYQKAANLQPGNAGIRLKLVDACNDNFYFSDAWVQLDSLYYRKEINFAKQLLLSKYCIHAGQFDRAASLLEEAKSFYPYPYSAITDLNGRMHLLAGEPEKAMPFYFGYLSVQENDYNTRYTIARLYAKAGKTKKAFEWLDKALQQGFHYTYVLANDPFWNNLRKKPDWKRILTSHRLSLD